MGATTLAQIALAASCLVAVVVMLVDTWRGAVVRSLLLVPLVCALAFGLGYAPYWYLSRTYADRPLFGETVR